MITAGCPRKGLCLGSQLTLQWFCRIINAKVSNLSFTFPAGKTQEMVDVLNEQIFFFFSCGNHLKISQVQQSKSAAQKEVMLWDDLLGGRGFGEVFLVRWPSLNSPSLAPSIKSPPKLSAAFPDLNPRAATKRAGTESMIHRDMEWVGLEEP